MAVRTDKTRKQVAQFVDLVSPNGTEITVSADRAEVLLDRPAVQRGDGTWHQYARAGESTEVTPNEAKESLRKSLTKGNGGE